MKNRRKILALILAWMMTVSGCAEKKEPTRTTFLEPSSEATIESAREEVTTKPSATIDNTASGTIPQTTEKCPANAELGKEPDVGTLDNTLPTLPVDGFDEDVEEDADKEENKESNTVHTEQTKPTENKEDLLPPVPGQDFEEDVTATAP